MRISPKLILFITFAAGMTAGYLSAPALLPLLTFAPQQHTQTQATNTPATTDAAAPATVPTATQQEITQTPATLPEPAEDELPDDIEEALGEDIDPDAFADATEEDTEADDPTGENTTPMGITSYRPRTVQNEDTPTGPFKEQTFTGKMRASAWAVPKTLKRRLAGKIRSRLKSTAQQDVENLLSDPEVRLMLAQWELLHRADLNELAKVMRNRDNRKNLEPLLNNLEWVSSFVYDGELQQSHLALAMVAHFRQADANMDKDAPIDGITSSPGLKRRVAGAIATQFTRNGWYGEEKELSQKELLEMKKLGYYMPDVPGQNKRGKNKQDYFRAARERYLYYAESIDKGLLHSGFDTLPTWLLHYTCGWKGNSPFGTASTMRWLRDNCAAPASAYVNMCYQVPYLPTNVYGDSIHSEWYYQPFNVLYPGNFAKETRDVGAVCGGLSHFGAAAACANGVPAITMGEPGHCAYAVYFDGSWHPANSLNPEERRSPHYAIWGEYTWKALQQQEDMYTNGALTRDAQLVITLATLLTEHRNPANGLVLYELAVQMQPLYDPVWNLYMDTACRVLGKRPLRWLGVNDFVCKSIAPQYPKSCAQLLMERIYPGMLKVLRSPKQKLAAYRAYFERLEHNENEQWDYNALLNTQYQSLGKALSHKEQYMQMLVDSVGEHPEFAPMLTWVIRTAYTETKSMQRRILDMIETAVAQYPEAKDMISCGVIRGAEEVQDIELANKWSKDYLNTSGGITSFEPVGGNLVSAGGLVSLSSYDNNQNSILYHAAALTERGGSICTAPGTSAHVMLKLPKKAHIGGIVLIANDNALSARGYLHIEFSSDGKNWKHLVDLSREESGQKTVRIKLKQNEPTAQYVRISDNAISGEAQLNLNAILVYDNKKTD